MRLYSNGKLLISGEYAILDGALSLATPILFGQYLEILEDDSKYIKWTSKNSNGKIWFQCRIYRENLELDKSSSSKISNTLIEIIKSIRVFNPNFLINSGANITTKLTFDKDWGLGSSSTLISNLSKLAEIDPFKLNNKIFNGSGYDIACAESNSPLLFSISENEKYIKKVTFRPEFHENIYFIYLNRKQNSLNEVKKYKKIKPSKELISEISEITKNILNCSDQKIFNELVCSHEQIISKLISKTTIKKELFNDFNGEIKSLGAWGGDFIMASSEDNPLNYFKNKGYNTVFKFSDLLI
jgi:mevalonate kinase